MSTWITLTVDDLAAYLNGSQLAALKTRGLATGQADPVADIIDEIVGGIRLEIASCDTNVLCATAHSIPPELKAEAAALIIEAAQTRLSIALKLSEDQKTAALNARKKLARIARCELRVSEPTDPEATPSTQGGSAIQSTQPRTQQASRDQLKGLV